MPKKPTDITLEEAAIAERKASDAMRGHAYTNVANRTPEDLKDIAVTGAKLQVAWLKAKNTLDEVIKREANE